MLGLIVGIFAVFLVIYVVYITETKTDSSFIGNLSIFVSRDIISDDPLYLTIPIGCILIAVMLSRKFWNRNESQYLEIISDSIFDIPSISGNIVGIAAELRSADMEIVEIGKISYAFSYKGQWKKIQFEELKEGWLFIKMPDTK